VVLLVLVVLKGVEVEEVEDTHQPSSQLQHGGESTVLGKLILVVPPPVGPGDSASVCNWVVELAAEQPGGKLVDLNLTKRQILLSVEHCWIIRSMDSLIVLRGKIAEHHLAV